MTATTCIRDIGWLVAWNAAAGRHEYLRGADLAFAGDRVTFAGMGYAGPADEVIDGAQLMVMPGLVNIHNHTSAMPFFKGVREELGSRTFYMSALYDGWNLFAPEPEEQRWASQYAYCEMLRSGVTTFADMCRVYPGWVETAAASGLRGYMAPLFQSARWHTENGHRLDYIWAEDGGRESFDAALALIDEAEAHACGRLLGMLAPMSPDTCTVGLMRDGLAEARTRGRPCQIHAGEAVMEFLEMTRRTGKTAIQVLAEADLLGPNVTIGHGIFLDHHSWLHWSSRDDVRLLADAGAQISHCPTVFARYGITLESFGAYRDAGVGLSIGTDTHPHNMLEEMRAAAMFGRVAAGNMFSLETSQVFHAATVGGADALGRGDLGRLAPGAKADLVLVALDGVDMMPVYDPLRCLVYTAADRAVRDVYVDGVKVLGDGRVLTLDQEEAAAHLTVAQQRIMDRVPARDYKGRTAHEVSPLTLPLGGANI